MSIKIDDIATLVENASKAFVETFGSEPDVGACAPGRVNIIGEHTDYNDGFVFPMALPLVTVVVGKKQENSDGKIRIKTLASAVEKPTLVEFAVPSISGNKLVPSQPAWANYVKGVVANFTGELCGFDGVILSSVPLGGGLSSSASLEVAIFTFLQALCPGSCISDKDKALACQKAEHDFANMPCGIMDQFISTMGKEGAALLIDCRSLDASLIVLDDPFVTFVIINSNVRHTLSGSEYPSRRKNCYQAAAIMGKKSLRDATLGDLQNHRNNMNKVMYKQVTHVITEISRTQSAIEALKQKDYKQFGQLMNESHISLKDDYKVSCSELDELVDIARSVPRVFGSRMTGGGFGGCTVTLVHKSSVDELINEVKLKYSGLATFYECKPSEGAHILSL